MLRAGMNNSRDHVNRLLKALSARAGIGDLELNDHDLCAVQVRSDQPVVFELSTSGEWLHLYAALPAPDNGQMEVALQRNFFGDAPAPALYSIDATSGELVVSSSRRVAADLTEEEFLSWVKAFLQEVSNPPCSEPRVEDSGFHLWA